MGRRLDNYISSKVSNLAVKTLNDFQATHTIKIQVIPTTGTEKVEEAPPVPECPFPARPTKREMIKQAYKRK